MNRIFVILLMLLLPASLAAAPVRVKDLADFDGVRGNDLVGYGLVVGLDGTGDGFRNAPFTEEMLASLLERHVSVTTTWRSSTVPQKSRAARAWRFGE